MASGPDPSDRHVGQVVDGEQAPGGRLPDRQQVAEVGPRPAGTGRAGGTRGRVGPSIVAWTALRRLSAPGVVRAEPWRASRVGATQSNWSTPSAIASSSPTGSPRPSGSGAGRPAARRTRDGEGLEHLRPRLADREAADAVAVEADGRPCAAALSARRSAVGPRPARSRRGAWSLGRASSRRGDAGPLRPGRGALDRQAEHLAAGREGRRRRRAPSGCRPRAAPGPRPRDSGVSRVPEPS